MPGYRVRTLALATLLATSAAQAQSLSGIVRNATTHGPVANVAVTLEPDSALRDTAAGRLATTTTFNGSFSFLQLPPGRYVVRFALGDARIGTAGPYIVAADSDVQRVFELPIPHDTVFFEFQVEKQVAPLPGNPAPRYPDEARKRGLEGEALVQFVVDTTGSAELWTFKVLRATDPMFVTAVRTALATMKFYPAEIRGRKVPQLVQQPFAFAIDHGHWQPVGEQHPPSADSALGRGAPRPVRP